MSRTQISHFVLFLSTQLILGAFTKDLRGVISADALVFPGHHLLQAVNCDSRGPYDGTIASSEFLYWKIENACLASSSSDLGCSTLSSFDCARACEANDQCRSVTFKDDSCCLSTKTYESAGSSLQSPCSAGNQYEFWQRDCPDDQSRIASSCPPLSCSPLGAVIDTGNSVQSGGVWTACRCPDNQIRCGVSCVEIGECGHGVCGAVTISGLSGDNAGVLNTEFTSLGLHDYSPYYQLGSGDIFLWNACQYGAWVITTAPGDISTLAAYTFSTAVEADNIPAGATWKVYSNGGYVDDNSVQLTCRG